MSDYRSSAKRYVALLRGLRKTTSSLDRLAEIAIASIQRGDPVTALAALRGLRQAFVKLSPTLDHKNELDNSVQVLELQRDNAELRLRLSDLLEGTENPIPVADSGDARDRLQGASARMQALISAAIEDLDPI
jgi:hypothetical protein